MLGELSSRDGITAKVYGSYKNFRARVADWSHVSIEAVLKGRA